MRAICTKDPGLPGTTLVAVDGSLDMTGAEAFFAVLFAELAVESPSLLLDLSLVEWVSSAGVGALVRLFSRTQALEGGFAIYGCAPRVRKVLQICGLEGPLHVEESLEAARKHVRTGS